MLIIHKQTRSYERLASLTYVLLRLTFAFEPIVRLADCETNTTISQISHHIPSLAEEIYKENPMSSSDHQQQKKLFNKPILPTLDVTNLLIIPELRAAKLSWNYEFKAPIRPTAFSIRYCELTSWEDEIKCRQKEFEVQQQENVNYHTSGPPAIMRLSEQLANSLDADHYATSPKTNNDHVITNKKISNDISPKTTRSLLKSQESLQDKSILANYEAHIYDLRAQTNYTFAVQASRFNNEDLNKLISSSKQPLVRPAARRLPSSEPTHDENEISDNSNARSSMLHNNQHHLISQHQNVAETKAFGAEATRCLADVSEVVVNTGRFFGGRISVEESQDPRCQLMGNRSSEQTTYLFRIDHELCRSKLVNGNHIETIVLVHENKDILTHNTARFLVLCNFLQNSFTLKASVSLPKVNGLMSGGKPSSSASSSSPRTIAANITQLPGKPQPIVAQQQQHQQHQTLENSQEILHRDTPQTASHLKRQISMAPAATVHDQPVRLGSMPGFFRSKHHSQAQQHQPLQIQQPRLLDAPADNRLAVINNNLAGRLSNDNNNDHLNHDHDNDKITSSTSLRSVIQPTNELAANAIKLTAPLDGQHHSILQRKNIVARARSLPMQVSMNEAATNDLSSEASDALSSAVSAPPRAVIMAMPQPEPVQVQSQVLFIARPSLSDSSSSTREARQLLPNGVSLIRSAASLQRAQASRTLSHKDEQARGDNRVSPLITQQPLSSTLAATASGEQEAIQVMTNNHRVSDNFPSLSTPPQATTPLRHVSPSLTTKASDDNGKFDQNYTIKYSAAPDVDNYSLGSISDTLAAADSNPSNPIHAQSWTPIEVNEGSGRAASDPTSRRMGKALDEAPGVNEAQQHQHQQHHHHHQQQQQQQQQFTLAQNITNQLLKFSLKTLTNVAKRTVELLAKGAENNGKQAEDDNRFNRSLLSSANNNGGQQQQPTSEDEDQRNYDRAQMSANDMIMMSMNGADDDDYEESADQTPAVRETTLTNNNNNNNNNNGSSNGNAHQNNNDHNRSHNYTQQDNQGREHVKLKPNSKGDMATSTIKSTSMSSISSSTMQKDKSKADDTNNNGNNIDALKMSTDNSQLSLANNSKNHDNSDIKDNKNNDDDNNDNQDDQITTTTKRPTGATRLTTRFSGNDSQKAEIVTISLHEQSHEPTSPKNLQQADSSQLSLNFKQAPSAHRVNGSRALKNPADDAHDKRELLNDAESDVSIFQEQPQRASTNDLKNNSKATASSSSLDASRRFNEVFEFREPIKRRSLIYWPLFSLVLLACIASAFVISIWFVSFRHHHYFNAAFGNNNHNNNNVIVDSNNNGNSVSPMAVQRKVAKISELLTQQKNGERPHSANNNNNDNNSQSISQPSQQQNQYRYPHGNNKNNNSHRRHNQQSVHKNESTVTDNCNYDNNCCAKAKSQAKLDVELQKEKMYATKTTNHGSLGLNGSGFGCERALSPSIRTLSPSFPYKNSDCDDDDHYNQYRRSSIGFENDRSGNTLVITTNHDYNSLGQEKESEFSQLKQRVVNSNNQPDRRRLENRPRSHCSSRGSDRTTTRSSNTSRSSFSRSISNGSTTLIAPTCENQENMCRDSEVLFSEHVLINLGSHRGESYA